jgi:hypothetical protein
MDALRRFGLVIAVLLFPFGISAVALFVGVYAVFDTPQSLKKALNDSGIYALPPQDSVASAEDPSSLPTTDPGIQQALMNALPPSFIQSSSDRAIDSVYSWAHGTTKSPDFSVDLSQVKVNFANNVAAYVEQKITALPPCTQIIAPPETTDELLAMTCRPVGISVAGIANRARQEVLNSNIFPENNTIDTASFKDAEGKPLSDQLAFVPVVHQYFIISLYVLPILTFLCMIAIVFWSLTKRAGVKRVAWIFIGTGLTNAVLAIAQVWLLHATASILGTPGSVAVQDKLLIVLEALTVELRNWWLGFGIGYIVLGIALLTTLAIVRPKPKLVMGQGGSQQNAPLPPNLPPQGNASEENKTDRTAS